MSRVRRGRGSWEAPSAWTARTIAQEPSYSPYLGTNALPTGKPPAIH